MDNKFLAVLVTVLVLTGVVAFKDQNVNVNVPEFNAGAVSGPDVNGPYLSVNGVTSFYDKATMKQATSTLCSFKSPNATSSLFSFSADFTTTHGGITAYALGNDPTAFSTTTIITAPTQMTYGANVQGTAFASSSNNIIPPNTYVNLKLSTTTAGVGSGYSPVGTCNVEFRTVR